MSSMQVYRFKNQKVIEPKLPQEKTEGEFPSQWFKPDGSRRPEIIIYHDKAILPAIRGLVRQMMETKVFNIKVINAYIYYVLADKGEIESHRDWESFGVIICKEKDKVNPFVMCNISIKKENLPNLTGAEIPKDDDDKWMVFWLLFQYRIGRATDETYKSELIKRANQFMLSFAEKPVELSRTVSTLTVSWLANMNFTKIVAAVDMYYCKFKSAPWAEMRYCTLGSRYKDCAALTVLRHISDLTSLTVAQLVLWVFTERMADEVEKISTEGNEVDKADSYMPYMRDFGISDKSPYSAQMNPSLVMFCHTIGCLLSSKRSMNARLAGEIDRLNSVINGSITAYVLGHLPMFVHSFGETPADTQIKPTVKDRPGQPPSAANPDEWFAYLGSKGFQLPPEIKDWVKAKMDAIATPRKETVGAYLKERGFD
ncbi:nucleoprotein [Kern Canyon virus]|uniref:Nucleoprotein n=1 Tax=Kern Canyon virus TaxID=380433 RepID=A0A0D3R100_9RHAB|nr:nucleoprotein [Kern Canyon virus]AJR28349.1 nucleoprotein [Kern Canyon virus]